MRLLILVFIGGGIGSALRYCISLGMLRLGLAGFPFATLAVNVIGGLAIGFAAGWLALRGGTEAWRLFLTTGVLGGFTTFSAFSLETIQLFEEGRLAAAMTYVGLSVALSLMAVAGGLAVVRGLS